MISRQFTWTLLLLALLTVSPAVLRAAGDGVISVDADDKAMNAAIASARKTLPLFWAKLEKPGAGEIDFHLKVQIEDKNGVEHFWCGDVQRQDGKLSGVINNDPQVVKNVSTGQRVTFKNEQISDWLFMRDGKMIGNYTLRPLLSKMPKKERRELEAILGPLP
jgi:uncharacterized protein YegJ (DUF2314 family)